MSEAECIRVLVIGPLPPPIGGTSVSLEQLISRLERMNGVTVRVINTIGIRSDSWLKEVPLYVAFVRKLLAEAARSDVLTLHASPTAFAFAGPPVWLIARLWRKPFVVRMFGGQHYLDQSFWRRKLASWIAHRADLFLAQTKALISAAQVDGVTAVRWLPTSRPLSGSIRPNVPLPGPVARFAYVGHIRESKGIKELLEAAAGSGPEIEVDFYGSFYDRFSEKSFENRSNVRYCGSLAPEAVVETLQSYRGLVLPSYHLGEGYPGVIIEAFAAGIPVICTRWRSLPELVDESCGILVDVGNVESLRLAMQRLAQDSALWRSLAENAWRRRKLYDIDVWATRFVGYCREVLKS